MTADKSTLINTINAMPLQKKAKLTLGKGAPKILTGYVHGRYFKGLVAETNKFNGDDEYSVELLIPKTDRDTMKLIMDGFDNTCQYMYNSANKKDAKEKAAANRHLKNYNACKDAFLKSKFNEVSVELCEEGGVEETAIVPNGEFSLIANGERKFHWPIKDGDLVRRNTIVKNADGEEVESSILERDLEVGRGGEVAGHYLVRIKLKSTDYHGKEQRPDIRFPNKDVMTEEDKEEFVSLDLGIFKFEIKAYGDGGISLRWILAQLKTKTEYRILGTGGGSNDEDLEDEEFDEEESWDD